MQSAETSPTEQLVKLEPFRKKTYDLGGFARDLIWLARHGGDVAALYLGRRISSQLREVVMAAVAHENACRWCSYMHREWAMHTGMDAEQLRHLLQPDPDGIPEDIWIASLYARRRAASNFSAESAILLEMLVPHYDARSRRLIEVAARMMTFANRIANTFDALLARLGGHPDPSSRVVDELAMSVLFLISAPVATSWLALLRRKGLLRLRREFRAFSRAFETKLREGRLRVVPTW